MADLVITSTQVSPSASASMVSKIASVAINAGQSVYPNTSGLWALADNNVDAATANAQGIAANTAAAGQPCWAVTEGLMTLGAGAAPAVGQVYCVGDAAGGIAPYADLNTGDWVTILGVGAGSNQINVHIKAYAVQKP